MLELMMSRVSDYKLQQKVLRRLADVVDSGLFVLRETMLGELKQFDYATVD